jgi:hypothetical protein
MNTTKMQRTKRETRMLKTSKMGSVLVENILQSRHLENKVRSGKITVINTLGWMQISEGDVYDVYYIEPSDSAIM